MSVQTHRQPPAGDTPMRAQAKETLWRLLALAVSHPTPEFHEALAKGEYQEAFRTAWQQVSGRLWTGAPASETFEELEAGYIHCFLHGRGGRPLAPLLAGDHESILAGQTRPNFMLNITAFYKHFGLRAARDDEGRHDEPDHLAAMAEFMAVLCHLEARALGKGGDPSPYRRAQRDFLCRYLSTFLAKTSKPLTGGKATQLDPCILQVLADMAYWAEEQIAELEARIGPFRDPDAPRPAPTSSGQTETGAAATQNLWG